MVDSDVRRGRPPAELDVNTPNVARMYDYYLGGKNNFPADRAAAEQILAIGPEVRISARANREFLSRAVRYLAGAGIRQFLDIGTGLPAQNNVHEVAHQVAPDAKVVYVDNDPVVLVHGRALLTGVTNATIIHGDLRCPEEILTDPDLLALLDLQQPVAVLLVGVLHFIRDEEDPAALVAAYRDAMTPGSYLVVSHATDDGRAADMPKVRAVYQHANAPAVPRGGLQITGFFEGFQLIEPGLCYVQEWGTGRALENPREMIMRAGVGCKL